METRLLAETIYSAVVHGQGTKRQTIDKIASMLEADRVARAEYVSNSYKFPEPRTCETCKTPCPDPGAPCSCFTPCSPQPADVETVREALVLAGGIRQKIEVVERCEEWTDGEPTIGTCRTFGRIKEIAAGCTNAIAALDRLAGKEE